MSVQKSYFLVRVRSSWFVFWFYQIWLIWFIHVYQPWYFCIVKIQTCKSQKRLLKNGKKIRKNKIQKTTQLLNLFVARTDAGQCLVASVTLTNMQGKFKFTKNHFFILYESYFIKGIPVFTNQVPQSLTNVTNVTTVSPVNGPKNFIWQINPVVRKKRKTCKN